MDAACYSWLKRWRISGFKPRVIGSKIKKMVELPIVLDSAKGQVTAKIAAGKKEEEADEETKDTPLTNLFEQLMKDDSDEDCSDLLKKPEEVKCEPVEGLHDVTLSIILSKMSTEAQTALFKLNQMGDKKLSGEEMLPYVKRKYAVACTKSYINVLTEAISSAL